MLNIEEYNKRYPKGKNKAILKLSLVFAPINLLFTVFIVWLSLDKFSPIDVKFLKEGLTDPYFYIFLIFFSFIPAWILAFFLKSFQTPSKKIKQIFWVIIIIGYYFFYFSAIRAISTFSFG